MTVVELQHTDIPGVVGKPITADTFSASITAAAPANKNVQIASPPARFADDDAFISDVVNFINDIYRAVERDLFTPSATRTTIEEMRRLIQDGEMIFAWRSHNPSFDYSELCSATVVGCIRIQSHSETRGGFGMLAVDPSFQGLGVGRDLVILAEEKARKMGKTVMQCEMLVGTNEDRPFKARLQAWYERLGYTVVDKVDFAEMWPEVARFCLVRLELRVFEKVF